jgi:hypothetical protein
MVDTEETKWQTQKQNGGNRNKMVDTETKWRTQKLYCGHRSKIAETKVKWRTMGDLESEETDIWRVSSPWAEVPMPLHDLGKAEINH